jgi:hypothetical protein
LITQAPVDANRRVLVFLEISRNYTTRFLGGCLARAESIQRGRRLDRS